MPSVLPRPAAVPDTLEEWRAGAHAAAGLLLIDDARQWGLLRGGPTIDRARCEEIIAGAAERGVAIPPSVAREAAVELALGLSEPTWPDTPERWEGSE